MNKSKYEKKYVKHYNYSRGIRCNDIKPIERKFFKYLMRQVDYEEIQKYKTLETVTLNRAVICYCKLFATKYNVPIGQLVYYLDKWNRRGIYDYDTSIGYGRFNLTKVFEDESERYEVYKEMMPDRTCRFINNALLVGKFNSNKSFINTAHKNIVQSKYDEFESVVRKRIDFINSILSNNKHIDDIELNVYYKELASLSYELNILINSINLNRDFVHSKFDKPFIKSESDSINIDTEIN